MKNPSIGTPEMRQPSRGWSSMRHLWIAGAWLVVCHAASAAVGIYTNVVMGDNPVAYWRLGEASGPTAYDKTANANNGTYKVNGGTLTFGITGVVTNDPNTAINVSAGSYMAAPHSASLNLTTGMTLEAWTALTTNDGYYQGLMMKCGNSGWGDGYGLYTYGGNLTAFINTYNPLSGNAASWAFGTGPAYHHLVSTFDGTYLKLYVDGQLKASTDTAATNITTNTGELALGIGAYYSPAQWEGKIDEVAIYNYALTGQQVVDHYDSAFYVIPVPEPAVPALVAAAGLLLFRLWRKA